MRHSRFSAPRSIRNGYWTNRLPVSVFPLRQDGERTGLYVRLGNTVWLIQPAEARR